MSGSDQPKAERVGDITGEPPTARTVNRGKALKLANLLEGLDFPATKEEIRDQIRHKGRVTDKRMNDILGALEKNLDDRREYSGVYDVEKVAGLVEQVGDEKPHVRHKGPNRANSKRISERIRPDPYAGRENTQPASARDVSPNTPKGEDV